MRHPVKKRPSTRRFDRAPQANIPRSTFDLSFPYKCTFDSGLLIPLPPLEILPGDSIRTRVQFLARLATPLHPTLDNLRLTSHFFFVPNRLVWDNWQKFMGEQDNPGDSTDFTIPRIESGTISEGSLGDYMGLPIGVALTLPTNISALPFRALDLCWNEWYRDENLQDSIDIDTSDAASAYRAEMPRRRGKRKDYISSSLPWPQKGPGVDLPLGTIAPVFSDSTDHISGPNSPLRVGSAASGIPSVGDRTLGVDNATPGDVASFAEGGLTGADPIQPLNLVADLTNATAATINELREAFQLQKLQERDARGGTRYTEIIKSHFMVTSPDSRLQRPEYIGGGVTPIQMAAIPQTSSTDATTPQGNLSAFGEGSGSHGYSKSFVEHGYVVGFISASADLNYQQRVDRMWGRQTKYDFYWPALQALGEQEVLNREVWADGSANDDLVWGYQERWAEYRTQMGVIAGKFRSAATDTLDPWHYALDFLSTPTLSALFIEDTPPIKRTIAVQTEPEFLLDAWFDIKAARPMPVYSVPGYIDHF